MTVLLDTDILIDVALDRFPFSASSARILDHAEKSNVTAFIAWHSVANFYYIFSSEQDESRARAFIEELLSFVEIAATKTDDALYALRLPIRDFEDALQVAAARVCGAKYIISRNTRHYRGSPIPAITPKDFLEKILEE